MPLEIQYRCSEKYILSWFQSLKECTCQVVSSLGLELAQEGEARLIKRFIEEYTTYRLSGLMSEDEYARVMSIIAKVKCRPDCTEYSSGHKPTVRKPRKEPFVGGLLVPRDLEELPTLMFAYSEFKAPNTIDLRDYCTKTEDQGTKPACAAYAASGFAENILWRKLDKPIQIEPLPLYDYAKKHDGQPNTDGTTLDAILKAVLDVTGYFDKSICHIKMLRNTQVVKYAVHKFGCCLLGMMVTEEWYNCNRNKSMIKGDGSKTLGGHAVLCCGYNRDGLIIQNSWGVDWGDYGFALITWDEVNREFAYGAVLDNCLYDTKMN